MQFVMIIVGVIMNMRHPFIISPALLMNMGALSISIDDRFMNMARMLMRTCPHFIEIPALFMKKGRVLLKR